MQDAGEIVGVANEIIVLGAWPRDSNRVAFLEGIIADEVRWYLAGDADDRDRIHHRICQACDSVGGAWSRRDENRPNFARGAGITFSSMYRALLMTHEHVLDSVLIENGIINRQHCATGITKNVLDTLIFQGSQDNFRAG